MAKAAGAKRGPTVATKWIAGDIQVDLERSRLVWSNGRNGNRRVELWADEGNRHVWAEPGGGDPVCRQNGLRELLAGLGLEAVLVASIINGDLTGLHRPARRSGDGR